MTHARYILRFQPQKNVDFRLVIFDLVQPGLIFYARQLVTKQNYFVTIFNDLVLSKCKSVFKRQWRRV